MRFGVFFFDGFKGSLSFRYCFWKRRDGCFFMLLGIDVVSGLESDEEVVRVR